MAPSLVATRGLTRDFGGLRAVDRVDFDLPEGQIRAVIGPNGAGKTTFVGLLCGRIRPSAGAVLWQGRDVTAWPAHRRVRLGIAYTFQITSVFGNLTLAENVALAVQRRSTTEPAANPAADPAADPAAETLAALDRVGLAARAGEKANAQSYGHRRLLEIAMGLALRPRLLILDEPTQGLAESEIDRFIDLVREVSAVATVLLIEHNMDVVMRLAERITVLEFGAVLAEGTPAEIRASRAVQAAYLGA